MTHLFLFSYARATFRNASCFNHQTGDRYNLLDLLYQELAGLVAEAEGGNPAEIGYRDQVDLAIGDPWPELLARAAATAKVLVAIVTPSYLQSVNCGREFQAFLSRHERLRAEQSERLPPVPIIPLFFEDQVHCWRHIPSPVRPYFDSTQYHQQGLPADYPKRGYRQLVELEPARVSKQVLYTIRDRICELKDLGLPDLDAATDFRTLPSAFTNPVPSSSTPDLTVPPADPTTLPAASSLPAMELRL
jgi:hypothetical protein